MAFWLTKLSSLYYLVVILSIIFLYLRPKKGALWLFETGHHSYISLVLLIFLIYIPILSFAYPLLWLGVALVVFIGIGVGWELRRDVAKGLIPITLFFITVAQEIAYGYTLRSSKEDIVVLVIYHFLGALLVIPFGGKLSGALAAWLFTRVEQEHLAIIREKHGPDAPRVIRLPDGQTEKTFFETPGQIAMTLLILQIWLVAKFAVMNMR